MIGLLAGLATPLWLITPDGRTVWLNGAARTVLDIPTDVPPTAIAAALPGLSPTELRALPPGRYLSTPVSFRYENRQATMTCRLTRAPEQGDEPLLLAEAASDVAAKQEVDRLTEQLVAISFAYPDLRFELRRDGTILDFAAADPTDVYLPPGRLLNRHIRDVLPAAIADKLDEAAAQVNEDEPVTGFEYTLPGERGLRHYECRVVLMPDGERVMAICRDLTQQHRAESALKASEARSRVLLEAVPDLVLVISRDGHHLDIVSNSDKLLVASPDSLLGRTVLEALPEAAARLWMEHIAGTLASDEPLTLEYWLPVIGGRRYFQARSVRYGEDSILSVIRDITELQRSREAVAQREAWFRLLLENAADLILIVDAEGMVRYESPSLSRLLGYQPDEAVGVAATDVLHTDNPLAVGRLLGDLAGQPGGRRTLDFRMRSSTGVWHAFEAVCTNLIDNPVIGGIVVNARDMTERRRAEQDAIEAHEMLLNAIESISEAFALYDAEGRLVLCNRKLRELYREISDLLMPGVRFEEIMREAVRRGQFPEARGREAEFVAERLERFRHPKGTFEQFLSGGRWVRVEERRTWDGATVGIRTDITEVKQREADLKAAHEEAERANQRKSDYVHHLSHELRTPLTAVIGFSQVIADDLMGAGIWPRYREYARQIEAAGGYMLDLINNILDLAKIEAGRMELNEEPCNLSLLVDMTMGLIHQRAAEAGIEVTFDLPDDLPELTADPHLIRQMLTNLATNAVKFCPSRNGRVVISATARHDGGLELSVADNGVGMHPDQIPLALDAFGQVHDREIARERGTGLGLPLTKALIELHGGSLGMDTAPGAGTTVRLVFPSWRVQPHG